MSILTTHTQARTHALYMCAVYTDAGRGLGYPKTTLTDGCEVDAMLGNFLKDKASKLGMVVQVCNPSTWESQAGGGLL